MSEVKVYYYRDEKKKRKKRKVSKITGERIYSRSQLEAGLWSMFSTFIRTRDKRCMMGEMFPPCSGALQAGHVIGRRKTVTKYNEMNVWGQCASHNWQHNRNPERFIAWFIAHAGHLEYLKLVGLSNLPAKKLSPQQLIDLTSEYARKIESLKG